MASAAERSSTLMETNGIPRLVREPLDRETLGLFFPQAASAEPAVPGLFYARGANLEILRPFAEHPDGEFWIRTNSLGMREDDEPSVDKPGLRVLVTGDSHIDGVCNNSESVPNVLERLSAGSESGDRTEVLNAAAGGYTFYNYLNVLESYVDLQPDVFLCIAYGGNDFAGMMQLQRFYAHRPAAPLRSQHGAQVVAELTAPGLCSQEVSQAIYFQDNPEDEAISVATCTAVALEMLSLCNERGIRLIFAYLPPHFRAQPEFYQDELKQAHELLDLEDSWLEVSDRIADRWLEQLRELGIETIDLRPALRESDEHAYYRSDRHLNPRGCELVGRALHAGLRLASPASN